MSTTFRSLAGVAVAAALAACGGADPAAPDDAAPPPAPQPPPRAVAPDFIAKSTPVAFRDVTLVPMDGPGAHPGQTVLVRDGRITAVGPVDQVPLPADATVIEGNGEHLMPGLADMHVHLVRPENLLLLLANGVTTIRNMWGAPLAILDWRDEVARGERLGPRIYSASRGLDGQPPAWPQTVLVTDAASARAAVEQEATLGFDFIKVYNSLDRASYDAIVAHAAALGIPVVGHVPRAVPLSHALASGQHTTEHLARYPATASDAFVAGHAGAGTWVSPTMIVRISFVNATDAAALEARDEMRFVHPQDRANWAPNAAAAPRAEQRAGSRARGQLLRALKDAGVGVLLGTDSWISYVIHGFSIHDELQLLVEDAGFTPYEALRAGTADAARSVGAAAEWGTIAVGLAADLVLLPGDPLEDTAALRTRSGVMAGGTWLSDAELDRRLEALAADYAGD